MGLFLIWGRLANILPQNSKRGQLNVCTVYVCIVYGVLFSPLWPAISVSS
jgi:hypothetical protein